MKFQVNNTESQLLDKLSKMWSTVVPHLHINKYYMRCDVMW